MTNHLLNIFEAINRTDAINKDQLMTEIRWCISKFISYYNTVINENIYNTSTPKVELNQFMMKNFDEQRRTEHNDCLLACSKLNEICSLLEIPEICAFDTNDRTKAAIFCGHIISDLYYSNI